MTEDRIILIAESDPTVRSFMRLWLARQFSTVLEAADGSEALSLAVGYKPDLVVTGLVMAKMDGFELVREIRKTKDIRLTPIIVVTGLGTKQQQGALNAGANLVLQKPVFHRQFFQAVNICLKHVPR